MDNFLRDIYFELLKKWIYYNQINGRYTKNENSYLIENDYGLITISFHNQAIIELSLENKITHHTDFYLHFRVETLHHTLNLFHELFDAYYEINEQKHLKILLSCSSGFTTSMFASMLEETSENLNLNYIIHAVSQNELEKQGHNYDLILLAPQISYLTPKFQSIFQEKTVRAIPSSIFAKYDQLKMIEFIKSSLLEKNEVTLNENLNIQTSFNHQILVICILKNVKRFRIDYRLYDNEQILLNDHIIKQSLSLSDIIDIIRIVKTKYPYFNYLGIASPGIIYNNVIHQYDFGKEMFHSLHNYPEYHVDKYIHHYYPEMHISIDNNANATAYGISKCLNTNQNIAYYFLPRGYWNGGLGIVINNQLLVGKHAMAGEIRYLPSSSRPTNYQDIVFSEDGNIKLIAKIFASIIAIIDPDLLAFSNPYITDIEKLKRELSQYIPYEYIPEIKKIECLSEYILFGEYELSIKKFL